MTKRVRHERRAEILCLGMTVLIFWPGAAWAESIFYDGFESGNLCMWSAVEGGALPYGQDFALADGSPWPAEWAATGSVDVAEVQGGMARFRPTPSGYSLARLDAPIATREVEVQFTVVFEDVSTQGVGFYVRQNGGYLDQTMPEGAGYAVFVEGFRGDGIGVWREVAGHEQSIDIHFDPSLGFTDGVPYRVRFRVFQADAATTRLQAKVWPVGASEPVDWHVDATDTTASLQGITGGIALDSWSSLTWPGPITAHTLVDDIEITQLCPPMAALGAAATVSEGFQFLEGPLWRGDHLLFSDIDGDTIHRLDPPAGFSVFRAPSAQANGLALDEQGRLLAAEHQGRRISVTQPGGAVETLVGTYQGMQFNSPNDLAVRSDGTIYFSDPDYGLANPADRELPFNGLFRRAPDGALTAEWQGFVGSNQPNGVALSPDESTLYVTDTAAGRLLAFDVAGDGALSNGRTLAEGLTIPDGMCVDQGGNVYVATWAQTLEIFDADGSPWGSVSVPMEATNCAFGGDAGRTMWVTAQAGLYRFDDVPPGPL